MMCDESDITFLLVVLLCDDRNNEDEVNSFFLATGSDEEQAGSAAEIVGKILAMVLFVRARVETKDAPAAAGLVGSCLTTVLLVGGGRDGDAGVAGGGGAEGHPSPNGFDLSNISKSPPSATTMSSKKTLYCPLPKSQQIPLPLES